MTIQRSIVLTVFLLLLSFGLGNFVGSAQSSNTVETRLQRLEDIEAIHALLIDYGRALDKRDFNAYGALFARDGSWKGGMGTATGPDAIAAMVAAGFGRMSPSLYEKSNHVMTSFDVEVDGDSATAWSRWTWVVVGANAKPQTERAGYYEDSLVRQNGEWKFKARQAFTEINP
jgi:uncharacterized protein (TIGR02246 family)